MCLNALRSRRRRREEWLEEHLPDPIISPYGDLRPEEQALLADSVGLALLIVLDTLTPAERLAFVLHDMFGLPFDEIAPMVDRTTEATRQLASRARRRVKGADVQTPDPDVDRQRIVVEAFFRASRAGDLDALVAVLHPDVVMREDYSDRRPLRMFRGSAAVASRGGAGSGPEVEMLPALINGAAGAVIVLRGRPFAVVVSSSTPAGSSGSTRSSEPSVSAGSPRPCSADILELRPWNWPSARSGRRCRPDGPLRHARRRAGRPDLVVDRSGLPAPGDSGPGARGCPVRQRDRFYEGDEGPTGSVRRRVPADS